MCSPHARFYLDWLFKTWRRHKTSEETVWQSSCLRGKCCVSSASGLVTLEAGCSHQSDPQKFLRFPLVIPLGVGF